MVPARATNSALFAPDAPRLLSTMHNIQLQLSSEPEPDEYAEKTLLDAFANLADLVGVDNFRPYIQDAFPRLVEAARKQPEINITPADQVEEEFEDDLDTVGVDGDVVAVRSSELETKAQAIESLVVLVQAISSALPFEALQGILEFSVPLLKVSLQLTMGRGGRLTDELRWTGSSTSRCTLGLLVQL